MTPRPEVRHYSRNQSSRNGVKPTAIVLHSTEGPNATGLTDLVGLGNWFDNPSAQASSHAANDAEGNDARFVPDSRKAWTCAAYNSQTLNIEQVGFASQKTWPEAQLRNTAEWIAYWSKLHGIPIQRGAALNGRITRKGVLTHADLGLAGGGHHDPGWSDSLIERCLQMARNADVDARKQAVWQRHLIENRARLKSLLALRARLRQNELESSARYAATGEQLSVLRRSIDRLKRLVK